LSFLVHIGTRDAKPEIVAKKRASFRREIIYITYVVGFEIHFLNFSL